jgi:hypothetical protein
MASPANTCELVTVETESVTVESDIVEADAVTVELVAVELVETDTVESVAVEAVTVEPAEIKSNDYPVTCVSCFFEITNKHGNNFFNWFNNSLKINCPYVIFGNKSSLEKIKRYRNGLPTHYIEMEITDFETYKYYNTIQSHPIHCPSKELNLIWNEKLFFIEKTKDLNIFHSEYFIWVDAGICTYRKTTPPSQPFPSLDRLSILAKDKFNFTSSDWPTYKYKPGYYHFISGTYALHKDFIKGFIKTYREACDKYLQIDDWIYTDQVILTLIYQDNKSLFKQIGHGYGAILPLLY